MTGEQVRNYIENELGCEPVHEVDALASAIEDMAIPSTQTHSDLIQ